jgi:YfiH family protein
VVPANENPVAWLTPDWPAPPNVRALCTLRTGGVSTGVYSSLNLAAHVGDDPGAVEENRARLAAAAGLPSSPCWLTQVHGTRVIDAAKWTPGVEADAAYSDRAGLLCTVLTADCLPVLLCDRDGTWVAAVHAGWKGLAAGILSRTVEKYVGERERLLAWIGPGIGPDSFEVGAEVREAFIASAPAAIDWFKPRRDDRWMGDLPGLVRLLLGLDGVASVFGGEWCTVQAPERFYSFRRDGQTGRMATLIWLV